MSSFFGSASPRPFVFTDKVQNSSQLSTNLSNGLYHIGDYIVIDDENKGSEHGDLYYIDQTSKVDTTLIAKKIANIAGSTGGSASSISFKTEDELNALAAIGAEIKESNQKIEGSAKVLGLKQTFVTVYKILPSRVKATDKPTEVSFNSTSYTNLSGIQWQVEGISDMNAEEDSEYTLAYSFSDENTTTNFKLFTAKTTNPIFVKQIWNTDLAKIMITAQSHYITQDAYAATASKLTNDSLPNYVFTTTESVNDSTKNILIYPEVKFLQVQLDSSTGNLTDFVIDYDDFDPDNIDDCTNFMNIYNKSMVAYQQCTSSDVSLTDEDVVRNTYFAITIPTSSFDFKLYAETYISSQTSDSEEYSSSWGITPLSSDDSWEHSYRVDIPMYLGNNFHIDDDSSSKTYGNLLYDGFKVVEYKLKLSNPLIVYTDETTSVTYNKDDTFEDNNTLTLLKNLYYVNYAITTTNTDTVLYPAGTYLSKALYNTLSSTNQEKCAKFGIELGTTYTELSQWTTDLSAGQANPIKYTVDAAGNKVLQIGGTNISLTGNKYGLLTGFNIDISVSTESGTYEPKIVRAYPKGNRKNYKEEKYMVNNVAGAVNFLNRVYYQGDLESHCTIADDGAYEVQVNNDDDFSDISTISSDTDITGTPLITIGERNSREKVFYAYDSIHETWYYVMSGQYNLSDYIAFEDISPAEYLLNYCSTLLYDDTHTYNISDDVNKGTISGDPSTWIITLDNVSEAIAEIYGDSIPDTLAEYITAIADNNKSDTSQVKFLGDAVGYEFSSNEPEVNSRDLYTIMIDAINDDKIGTTWDDCDNKIDILTKILEDKDFFDTAINAATTIKVST